jgi:CheY-like chemotaxis protein
MALVLVVDDDLSFRFFLKALFETDGHEAVAARNGAEGLETARRRRPDLVVLDVMMPGGGGLPMYRAMQADPALRAVPVIMLSGVGGATFAHGLSMCRAADGGGGTDGNGNKDVDAPFAYVEKPPRPDRLLELAHRALDGCRTGTGNGRRNERGGGSGSAAAEGTAREEAGADPDGISQRTGQAAAAQRAATHDVKENERMPYKILVVDDDPYIVKYMVDILSDNGYATCSASDGSEALEVLQRERPDLVTLDLEMPNEWGPRFYRKMTKEEAFRDIPVIVISGLSGIHLAIRNAVASLKKPFDPNRLLEIIRDTLEKRGELAAEAPEVRQ